MNCFVAVEHFGGEMNCLAKLCVGTAGCLKSFEKVTTALQNVS